MTECSECGAEWGAGFRCDECGHEPGFATDREHGVVDKVVMWTALWPAVLAVLFALGAVGAPEALLGVLAVAMWAMVVVGALACAVSMWRSRRSSLWILTLVFTMPAHLYWAHQVWSGST